MKNVDGDIELSNQTVRRPLTIALFGDLQNEITKVIRSEINCSRFAIIDLFVGPSETPIEIEDVDLIISAAYPKILSNNIIKSAKIAALNIHPSILPAYRGVDPIAWALLDNQKEVGVTIHEMIANIDAGNIAAQCRIPVHEHESLESLNIRVVELARNAFVDIPSQIYKNRSVITKPQIGHLSMRRSSVHELKRLEINSSFTAEEISRRVKIFPFRINFQIRTKRIYLWRVSVPNKTSEKDPGTILNTGLRMNVVCANNSVISISLITGVFCLPRRNPLRLLVLLILNLWFRIRYLPGTKLF